MYIYNDCRLYKIQISRGDIVIKTHKEYTYNKTMGNYTVYEIVLVRLREIIFGTNIPGHHIMYILAKSVVEYTYYIHYAVLTCSGYFLPFPLCTHVF